MIKRFLLTISIISSLSIMGCSSDNKSSKTDTTKEVTTSSTANESDNKATNNKDSNIKDSDNKEADNKENQTNEDTTKETSTDNAINKDTPLESIDDKTLKEFYDNAVFIGDSRVEGLLLYTDLCEYSTFYSKVGLNISKALEEPYIKLKDKEVTLLQAMETEKFDKVFIMLGFNELGWPNYSVFLEKYSTLISEIKKLQPDAKIYLQSILHVTESHSASEEYENNKRVNLYNKNIKKLADNKTVFYINLNPCFDNKNKALKEDSTTDGIHLKPSYYDTWMRYLVTQSQQSDAN